MRVFLDYLRHLIPLVKNGFTSYLNSSDAILKRVATSPDRLLPFRQMAPTLIKAYTVIYSNKERLRTRAGLFNVLMFRGVFYGSPFASEDLVWFNDLEEWESYYENSQKTARGSDKSKKPTKERYFVCKTAYGPSLTSRSTEVAATYWEESKGWVEFLKTRHRAKEVFDWFLRKDKRGKKIFPNIGPLCALLMLGDLMEADGDYFTIPSSATWGELVHELDKGAKNGLLMLGLLDEKASSIDTTQSFSELYQYLAEELDDEEKALIGFNTIMLEHGLCKRGRILPKKLKTKKKGKVTMTSSARMGDKQ